jgi:capsular polysaccharide biosynthesis protein
VVYKLEKELDLFEIFDILNKRKRVILAIVIAATLLGAVYSYWFVKPKYEASADLIYKQEIPKVEALASDVGAVNGLIQIMNQQFVGNAVAIMKSENFLQNFLDEHPKYELKVVHLEEIIEVTSEAQLISVKVTSSKKSDAIGLASDLSKQLTSELKTKLDIENVKVLYTADESGKATSTGGNKLLPIVIAFIVSLMGSIGLVLFIETISEMKRKRFNLGE